MDVGCLSARLALSGRVVVVASTEQKAVDTAEALGIDTPVRTTIDLGEVAKPWFDDPADHHCSARAYLRAQPLPGWEPIEAAVSRFQRALDEHLGDADVVAITHATVMTAWLAAAGVVAASPSFCPSSDYPTAGRSTWPQSKPGASPDPLIHALRPAFGDTHDSRHVRRRFREALLDGQARSRRELRSSG